MTQIVFGSEDIIFLDYNLVDTPCGIKMEKFHVL
jgi:hypothetical protein